MTKKIIGLVLTGGESRRFGTDKALAQINRRPLIAHAVQSLVPRTEVVILCGRSYLGMPHIPDRPTSGLGPLGGLKAGLYGAPLRGNSHVLAIACDTPFIPANSLHLLAMREGPCVVAQHPVVGIWPANRSESLDQFLQSSGRKSMRAWVRKCAAAELSVEGIENFNLSEDFLAYRKAVSIKRSRP